MLLWQFLDVQAELFLFVHRDGGIGVRVFAGLCAFLLWLSVCSRLTVVYLKRRLDLAAVAALDSLVGLCCYLSIVGLELCSNFGKLNVR